MNKNIFLTFLVLILLVTSVSATVQTNNVTFVNATEGGGGGGGAPATEEQQTEAETVLATLDSAQITVVNERIAELIAEFGDPLPQEQLDLLAAELLGEGIEVTAGELSSIAATLGTITVVQGGIGGGGFELDEDFVCDIQVQPGEVVLDVDTIAAEIKISNFHSESITPQFGISSIEGKADGTTLVQLRGEVSTIAPQSFANIIAITFPKELETLQTNHFANLRVIVPGCKDSEVPIKLRAGTLLPFFDTNTGIFGNFGNFFSFLFDILGEDAGNLFGIGIKFWMVFLMSFGVLWLTVKSLKVQGFIIKIASSSMGASIITVLLYNIIK